MRILVTGSSGHLGEALMRVLRERGDDVIGRDTVPSPYTTVVGSITDRECVQRCVDGVDAILHTATLHKPHVGSHRREQFVETNVTGTLNLLEEAVAAGVGAFVYTSTTSTFGRALTPADGEPAAWITEDLCEIVSPQPRLCDTTAPIGAVATISASDAPTVKPHGEATRPADRNQSYAQGRMDAVPGRQARGQNGQRRPTPGDAPPPSRGAIRQAPLGGDRQAGWAPNDEGQ